MNMKKKSLFLLSCVLLLTLATGCGGDKKEKTANQDQTEQKEQKNSNSFPVAEGMKVVGDSSYGFVNIPKNWTDFQDPNAPHEQKFSNDSGTILTLGNPVKTEKDASVDSYLNEAKEYHKALGATSTTVENVAVDKQETPCVLSHFDSGVEIRSFVFLKDGTAHLLSVEGLPDHVKEASQWIEKTYRLQK